MNDPTLRAAVLEAVEQIPPRDVEGRRVALAYVLEPNIAAIHPATERIAVLRSVWDAIGHLDAASDLESWWAAMQQAILPGSMVYSRESVTEPTTRGTRRRVARVSTRVG